MPVTSGEFVTEQTSTVIQQIRQRVPDHAPDVITMTSANAAVLMAITDAPAAPELILTRRAIQLTSHAGEVAFPGGKRDATDPDLLFTALRESHEEIALLPGLVEMVGPLPFAVSKMGLQVVPFVGIIPHQIELTPNADEIDCIFRVPLAFFLEQPTVDYTELDYLGGRYRVPCFQFEDQIIWGLTAHFIADFCNRVFDSGFDYFRPQSITNIRGETS